MFREGVGLDDHEIAAFGNEVADVLVNYRPALAREIEGIAAGASQPVEELFAVNARTELLSGALLAGLAAGECSTIAALSDDGREAILVQTWDFHPDLAASRVVWTQRWGSDWFTLFTEAGILGKMGVNSSGLAVGLNFLATDRDARSGGVPVHVLARVLVEEAATVPEALDLLRVARTSASVCLTVAGPGDAGTDRVDVLAFELWPGGIQRSAASGSPPYLVHTNHFLEPIAARDVLGLGPQAAGTLSRYEQLVERLERDQRRDLPTLAGHLSTPEAPAEGGQQVFLSADQTQPWLERCATLATLAFEVPSGRFWLRDSFNPCVPLTLLNQK
jgi:isopenicillin-N N-acyltransferase-like protein